LEEAQDPFLWWSKHEGEIPIVAKLAKMILGIPSNQIEIKNILNCRYSHRSSPLSPWSKELKTFGSFDQELA
jgi:hypothetical protein